MFTLLTQSHAPPSVPFYLHPWSPFHPPPRLRSSPFPPVSFSPPLSQGLPRTYNKDLQEDKEPLFDTVSTVHDCLRIAAGVVATMTPNADNLRAQLVPEMLATDLADYLVRKVRDTVPVSSESSGMCAWEESEGRGCWRWWLFSSVLPSGMFAVGVAFLAPMITFSLNPCDVLFV